MTIPVVLALSSKITAIFVPLFYIFCTQWFSFQLLDYLPCPLFWHVNFFFICSSVSIRFINEYPTQWQYWRLLLKTSLLTEKRCFGWLCFIGITHSNFYQSTCNFQSLHSLLGFPYWLLCDLFLFSCYKRVFFRDISFYLFFS